MDNDGTKIIVENDSQISKLTIKLTLNYTTDLRHIHEISKVRGWF